MASSDAATIIAAVSGTSSALALLARARTRRRAHLYTAELKRSDVPSKHDSEDLADVHRRLFQDVGRMSLEEFARDQDARTVVERAVGRAQALVEASPEHIERAHASLAEDDTIAALSRARLALELALRDLATVSGLDIHRPTGGAMIAQLVRAEVLDPETAALAQDAFRTASAGMHGEPITPEEARGAVDAISTVVRRLTQARPTT